MWKHDDNDVRRVVVTGMGLATPLAENPAEFRDSLMAGRSNITRWKRDWPNISSEIGGDMSEFKIQAHFERQGALYPSRLKDYARVLLRTAPPAVNLAVAAALQSYVDAGLPDRPIPAERLGHLLAGTNFNSNYIQENSKIFADEPDFIEPLYGVMVLDTDVLARVSDLLALKGPTWTVGNACGSSNVALINAMDLIRNGRADGVVVSAVSGGLDPVVLHGWGMLGALSSLSYTDDPKRASRPFDKKRDGFVPSEGAAAVVLENLASARARGARIHAEILGGASASDGSCQIRPFLDGQVRAICGALDDARVNAEQIDYVNAHATSTPLGDEVEVASIKQALGKHAYEIPVNATKSMTGHHLNAAAMVELVAIIVQMQNSFVHPTINLEEPDDNLDLDFVAHRAREHKIHIALSNSFGFGGLNSSVIIQEAPGLGREGENR